MSGMTEREGVEQRAVSDEPIGSVNFDEMAFAMALFFAAARGQVPLPRDENTGTERRSRPESHSLALGHLRTKLGNMEEAASDEVPLACAVAAVWHHYEGAPNRQTICSRLVAFYSLVVRSQGTAVEGNVQALDGVGGLGPSLIQAVATAPVSADGQFDDLQFRELVVTSADRGETVEAHAVPPVSSRIGTPITATEAVQELVELLFACEATIAAKESESHPFRVLERLSEPFAAVSGAQSLRPLLLRALASTRASYPWLSSAQVTQNGRIEGIAEPKPGLDPQEALQGELALMGSLIELLRSLLGDGVTLQLLKAVWPLASIKATS